MQQSIGVHIVRVMMTYGLIFVGIVLLLQRDYVAAVMAICLGSGFWLSMDTDTTAWQRRPRWQRVLAITLVLTSFALLLVQFVQFGITSIG